MRHTFGFLTCLCLVHTLVHADQSAEEALQTQMKEDVVLRAMVDELERNKTGLKLEDLERPYFIEYALTDGVRAFVSAQLGTTTHKSENRSRYLKTDIRVGSYQLDNTNFSEGGWDFGGFFGGDFGGMMPAVVPIEDDYDAIRQAVWWATDRSYKNVVETFEQKKAFMEGKLIKDKPADFSRETPVVFFQDRVTATVPIGKLESAALHLSGVFREFPAVQDATVSIEGGCSNYYLVNTEGTRMRIGDTLYSLSVSATVQADDGMMLTDTLTRSVRAWDQLPALDELSSKVRKMVEQLLAARAAPMLDAYAGPVLLEKQAAAAAFAQLIAYRFSGGQRPVGSRSFPDDFANKLNHRILPRFLNVVDDPTQTTVAGAPALGHYEYDDQGVKARPVKLVENGRLLALLMSRNPSKEADKSTGHGRGAYSSQATVGCMVVSANPASTEAEMRQELIEACQDEGLEFGLRIASFGSVGDESYGGMYFGMGFGGYSGYGSVSTPLAVYKVFPDGREELVRGLEIDQIDMKAFKRILAMGDTPHIVNTAGPGGGETIAVPSMLFEELDLAKIDSDFDKPPILPNPLARKDQE